MQFQGRYRGILLLQLLLCGLGSSLPAQQDWTWTFGDSVVMKFPGGGVPFVDANARSVRTPEGGSCISDINGNLRYFAMNQWLYRADGSIPPGGFPLTAPDLTNPYIILPVWGDTTDALIFFADIRCGSTWRCPWFQEVKGPLGADNVIEYRSLGEYHPTRRLSERVAAVRDAGGTGWWVLFHGILDNAFVKFHVLGNQVMPLDTQQIGSMHVGVGSNPYPDIGEMCFSPQGDRVLIVSATGIVDVLDFDRCTGDLSNWRELGTPAPNPNGPNTYYGCSFSPDGNVVYVSEAVNSFGHNLYQWDLTSPNISSSKTLIHTTSGLVEFGQHQLGPDGKIYLAQHAYPPDPQNPDNYYLSVIQDPNQAGVACNFVYNGIWLVHHL